MASKILTAINTFCHSIWQKYQIISISPDTIGNTFKHRLCVVLLYSTCFMFSIYMTVTVLNNQPRFNSLITRTVGTYTQAPSVLLCPEMSATYKYSFLHKPDWNSKLNLSVAAVNMIAKAASEGQLDSDERRNSVRPYIDELLRNESATLRDIWNEIAVQPTNALDFSPYYESVPDNVFLRCKLEKNLHACVDMEDIWLTDKSYCFLWNKTGTNFLITNIGEWSRFEVLIPVWGMRVWLGNLETTPVSFRKNTGNDDEYYIDIYSQHDTKVEKVCQPKISGNCTKEQDYLTSEWAFVTSELQKAVTKGYTKAKTTYKLDIYLRRNEWYEVVRLDRFSTPKVLEIIGNLFGIWCGISIYAVIKGSIVLLRKQCLMKDWTVLFIQMGMLAVLAIETGGVQFWSYRQLQEDRFANEVSLNNKNGLRYPSIEFCPRFNTALNYSMLKEYNVSHPLLEYITVMATLRKTRNYVNFPKDNPDSYFLWDRHAPAELGYHWNFIEFPLQSVSESLYEKHMTKVENEYKVLCEKLGIDPNIPSWYLFKRLTLNPCKFIKYCYIDGIKDLDCCKRVKYRFNPKKNNYLFCWKFEHDPTKQQNVAGTKHGFRILLVQEELRKCAPELWFDDYMKEYMQKCSLASNCSIEPPKGWHPYNALLSYVNNGTKRARFSYVYPANNPQTPQKGEVVEIALSLTFHSKLSYRSQNNCSDSVEPSFERYPEDGTAHKDAGIFYKEALLKSVCGCYACFGKPAYERQAAPCCTPKVLGRCITNTTMYNSQNGIQQQQLRYAGNLPTDAPINAFLDVPITWVKKLFLSPDGAFHKYIKNVSIPKELKYVRCSNDVVGVTLVPPKINPRMDEKEYIEYNFYFSDQFSLQFVEKDLQNSWELLGLFCGSLGLSFGITFIGLLTTLSFLFHGVIKILRGNETSEKFISAVTGFSLSRFTKRFSAFNNASNKIDGAIGSKQLTSHDATLAEAKPCSSRAAAVCEPINDKQEVYRRKNNYLELDEEQVHPEHSKIKTNDGNAESKINPLTNSIKFSGECSQNETIAGSSSKEVIEVKEVMAQHPDLSASLNPNDEDSILNKIEETKGYDVFWVIVVLIAVALTGFSCSELYNSMQLDQRQSIFKLNQTQITIPSLGVCRKTEGFAEQDFPHRKLLKSMSNCTKFGIYEDCKLLFVVFFQSDTLYCVISYPFMKNPREHSNTEDLTVEVEGAHTFLWVGDVTTIEKGNINVKIELIPAKAVSIVYEEWEVIDKAVCLSPGEKLPCPICTSQEILSICCATENFIRVSNISIESEDHCTISYYPLRQAIQNMDGPPEITLVTLGSDVDAKRVIRQEIRRTFNEKFMLFVGFFDLYIGINIINLVYSLGSPIARQVQKRFMHSTGEND